MRRIIFLVYHGMGHFNACFRVAKELQSNCQVYFAGVEFFKRYVTAQGFTYYPLRSVPFGMGFENWINTIDKKKHVYFNSLLDRYRDTLYHHREKELYTMMDALRPDVLIIDSLQASDFIVLYPYIKRRPVRLSLIHIILPTTLKWDCPPINSLVLPGNKLVVGGAVFMFQLKRIIKSLFYKVKYAGLDNDFLIRRRRILNNVPEKYFNKKPSFIGLSLQNIHEFILSSSEFDFKENRVSSYQHYIGSFIDKNRIDICDENYIRIAGDLKKELSEKKPTLIYCSFGTVKAQYERSVRSFIKRLARVAVKNNHRLIVSSGGKEPDLKINLPGIYLFRNVPQCEVLSMADVFITHGGLNSIKESIDAEVPMLVYLAGSYGDQKGNSSRVIFHQLGLRGSLRLDSEQEITDKINELIHNPVYKQKIRELKRADNSYTIDNFRNLVNQLTPLP